MGVVKNKRGGEQGGGGTGGGSEKESTLTPTPIPPPTPTDNDSIDDLMDGTSPTETDALRSVGNYLLLKVPDFADSDFPNLDATKTKMTSYLRLGANPTQPDNQGQEEQVVEPGDELLEHLKAAGPPGDPTDPNNRNVFFIDDVRYRVPNDGHNLAAAGRQAESAKLFSRGGWRDHSDGNRISTTYGDKVEVVRGNYKMVVMGRQDDPEAAMGWDSAGSHIQDFAPGTMPGASVYTHYIQDYDGAASGSPDGVWLLVNSTENVYEYARNAGNFREEGWGDLRETFLGSENPKKISTSPTDGTEGRGDFTPVPPLTQEGTGVGLVRSNPKIVEKTWATEIDTATGSKKLPVPKIKDVVWADQIDETVNCTGAITSTTNAAAVNERAAVGAVANSMVCGPMAEALLAGSVLNSEAITGVKIETSAALGYLTFQWAIGTHVDIDIHTTKLEVSAGLRLGIEIGAWYEVNLGFHDDCDFPEKVDKSMKKTEQILEQQRQAINFNASVLKHCAQGVKLKMMFGKIDLGL